MKNGDMGKTPTDFYAQYNNKRVNQGKGWNDSRFGYQCVAGYKCFCEWAGIPVKATPNNLADGYWYYRDQLDYSAYFDYVTNGAFKNGDWVIWAKGSQSHPSSHIAMLYNDYEFGENQGGNGGFCLKKTNFSDALGALRWKGWNASMAKTMNGIDISNWQKDLDISKVPCDFVIVKATEGVNFVDKTCDQFYQKAKKLGKKLGFYHFARPEWNNAIDEAVFFWNNTKNYFHEAIPILDWESAGKANVTWAKTWLDKIYELSGVRPMIYMSESVVNSYDWSSVVKGNYGLWVAKYRDNQPDWDYDMSSAGNIPNVKWWSFYAMWQWTSTGRFSGYNGNLDCDIFYGDSTTWDAYAGVKQAAEVKPDPEPETDYKSLYEELLKKHNALLGENADLKNKIQKAQDALS